MTDTLLRALPVVVIDLEMTGLSKRDRVCEVALVTLQHGEIVEQWSSLVRPPVPMTAEATQVTGLTDDGLATAPPFESIAEQVRKRTHHAVVLGHNVDFDLGFLRREFNACGVHLPTLMTIDTLQLARRLFAFRSNRLVEVAKSLGIALPVSHRALDDALVTLHVWHHMVELLDPHGEMTLDDLELLLDLLAPNSPHRLRQKRLLRVAYRARKSVWIDYMSNSSPLEGLTREVAIWRLRRQRLQGWCFLREGERVFRLDRIRSVRPGERSVHVPDFESKI